MKKLIPTIALVAIFTVVFIFCFRSCASATELVSEELIEESESTSITETTTPQENEQSIEEEFDLKLYITERIVPVVVGVLTAIAGLLSTIFSIKRSVRSLTNLKNSFSEEKSLREASLADNKNMLQKEISRVQEQTKDLPEVASTIGELKEEMSLFGEMIQLMCESNPDLVRTGKAKKMALLVNKIKATAGGNTENESKV